jgi:hypothetical protein
MSRVMKEAHVECSCVVRALVYVDAAEEYLRTRYRTNPEGVWWNSRVRTISSSATAIAELTKAVQRTGGKQDVMAFVMVGPRDNPAGRSQVRGANGKYISVEYRANTRKVTNGAGDDLRVTIPIK